VTVIKIELIAIPMRSAVLAFLRGESVVIQGKGGLALFKSLLFNRTTVVVEVRIAVA
jgi:hypothetical protein